MVERGRKISAYRQRVRQRMGELEENNRIVEIMRRETRDIFRGTLHAITIGVTAVGIYFSAVKPLVDKLWVEEIHFRNELAAQIDAGDYTAARQGLDTLVDSGKVHHKKLFLLEEIVRNRIHPERAGEFIGQIESSPVNEPKQIPGTRIEVMKDARFATGIGQLRTKQGEQFALIGDSEGGLYATNGKSVLLQEKIGVQFRGNPVSLSAPDGRVTALSALANRKIIKIEVMENETTDTASRYTLMTDLVYFGLAEDTDAGRLATLSENPLGSGLSPMNKLAYFVCGAQKICGIDAEGDLKYIDVVPRSALPEQRLTVEYPLTVTDDDHNGFPEIYVLTEERREIAIFDLGGQFRRTHLKDVAYNSVLVGDVNGDQISEVLVDVEGSRNDMIKIVFGSMAGIISERGIMSEAEEDFDFPEYHWLLRDLNRDGINDVVYTTEDGLHATFGGPAPFWKSWSYEEWNHFTAKPLITDVDGDGRLEIIAGSREGKLHIVEPENGYHLLELSARGEFNGAEPRLLTLNGEQYLCFNTTASLYVLGRDWFKGLIR